MKILNEGTAQIRHRIRVENGWDELLRKYLAGCLTGGEIVTVWAGEQLDVWRTLGALEDHPTWQREYLGAWVASTQRSSVDGTESLYEAPTSVRRQAPSGS